MAQKTDAQLTTEKEVIKNETVAGANTCFRNGVMLEDIIDSKINNDRIGVTVSTPSQVAAAATSAENNAKTYADGLVTPDATPTVKGKAKLFTSTGSGTDGAMDQNSTTNALAAKQNSLGFTPENVANKATGFGTVNDTLYPTVKAVNDKINSAIEGLKPKDDVRIATTANITLSGLQTIDGILTVAGNRVLVKDQTTQSQNGIYLAAVGAWTRTTDADTGTEIQGAVVSVDEGTTNADLTFRQTADNITLGTTSIVWTQYGTAVPDASSTTKGKAKLFTGTGTGTDGAMDQNSVTTALAGKVDETDWVTLTDASTTTWDTTNVQSPLAKWTMGATSRTLAMTNLKSGASGLLVVKTGVSGAITVAFPAGSVTDAGSLASYTFPAGINVFYDLSWYYDSSTTTIKWIIGVSNIDTDVTLAANSDLLVASQKATKTYSDTNLNTALNYTDSVNQFNPWKNIVDVATTAALPSSTIDGPYQIITGSTNVVLTVDGQTGFTKLLVKDQPDQRWNGKFDVIAPGVAGVSPWQIRRSTDFDASNKIRAAVLRVLNGTVNAGKFFKQDTPSVTIGTSNIVFTEFGGTTSNTSQFSLVQSMRNFYGY